MQPKSIAVLLLSVLALVGCGDDGRDGSAYLAFDWVATPVSYTDDNPRVPSTIFAGVYYLCIPGTYLFLYEAWDNSIWAGTYTLAINQGEDGGLFFWSDGDDGRDNYFELGLYSIGPTLTLTKADVARELAVVVASGRSSEGPRELRKAEEAGVILKSPRTGEGLSREVSRGRYRLKLDFHRVYP